MINEANLSAVYGHDQKVFTDQSGGAVKVGTERRVREREAGTNGSGKGRERETVEARAGR